MKVTIKTIADEVGVSKSTVSYVLNGRADQNRIPEKTRDAILHTAKKLNYRPNILAKNFASGRSMTLGLIVPNIGHPFIVEVVQSVQQIARERGYHIIIGDTRDDIKQEKVYYNEFIERRVDGLIVMPGPAWDKNDLDKELRQINVPLVILGKTLSPEYDSVCSDRFNGAFIATDYLLKNGHKKIVLITSDPSYSPTKDKIKGYKEALKKNNIKCDEKLLIRASSTCAGGVEAARKILEISPSPTAIFASNDEVAMGVIKYFNQNNISVPDTMNVIGYDNTGICEFSIVPLTTIDQSHIMMGKKAVELLLDKINNSNIPPVNIVLQPQLIIRESTHKLS